jgi:hypothetical protein
MRSRGCRRDPLREAAPIGTVNQPIGPISPIRPSKGGISLTDNINEIEARLAELRGKRDTLATSLTRDGAERAAKDFAEGARQRADVAGYILNGAAVGDPLQAVLNAFVLDHPDFERWATETATAVEGIELSDKQRDSRLRKLESEIAAAEKQHLAARKKAALEQIERDYADNAAAIERDYIESAAA